MKEKLEKLDRIHWGVIFALVLTVLGFLLSYPVLTRGEIGWDFTRYINYAKAGGPHRQNILIFSLLPNMFMFYLSNFRWSLYEFTKGLVGTTLVLGLILVIVEVL